MKTIITHPDNVAWLKDHLRDTTQVQEPGSLLGMPPLWGTEIKTNPALPVMQPTGRYVLPDGRAVAKEDVRIRTRFIDYGPEDIPELLYRGVINEEQERFFYEARWPSMTVYSYYERALHNSRAVLKAGAS